ncbi:MAG TPA: RNA 2',3'-cyclic phosphodiesterase [Myxococcota bacterium]|nr:RNA 2',3'-cyclic phosphodiesterase [Myxococcota bacterium]
MLRTFFALEIGEEARRAAAALVERLRADPGCGAVRWTRPEAFHVTLRFLGPTPAERVPALAAAVRAQAAGIAPFALALEAVGAFPDERRPRVVFVALEPHEPVAALAAGVERGVVAAGFPPEARPFHAHLTLGRVRERRRRVRLPASERPAPARFPVDSAVLFRSDPSPAGSTYTPLERIALGGVASP